jgi:3'-phosphoadenosine 5'-phosphosulfate sulfotransferase (PAPS reductase)/FAD synthetase
MICKERCKAKRPTKAEKTQFVLGSLIEKAKRCAGVVVAYGGGVDSTAMIIRLVELRIPIRAILFADTGSELPRTYQFILLFSDWLEARGYPRVTTVRNVATRDSAKGAKKGVFESLEDQLLRLGNLPPPAFTKNHTCALKMKIRPQDKWIEAQTWAQEAWILGEKILKLIGFENEEGYRANRAFRESGDDARFELHFPLVEWGWSRETCEKVIADAGLPSPGKSACFFCPMRKEEEIEELRREYPELHARALELEARALASGNLKNPEIRGLRGRKGTWKELEELRNVKKEEIA